MPAARPVGTHEQERELESFGEATGDRLQPGSSVFLPCDAEHGALATGGEALRLLYVFAADSFQEIQCRFSPAGSGA